MEKMTKTIAQQIPETMDFDPNMWRAVLGKMDSSKSKMNESLQTNQSKKIKD
jgi:hypothetical protein